METNKFDEYTQVNTLTWHLERNGQLFKDEYYFRIKMFYPHEMDILLDNSGLIINNKMGDYEGSRMNEKKGMQIYVCGRV